MTPWRRALLALLDRPRTLDEDQLEALAAAMREDPGVARRVKDQLLLDERLSRHFSPGRRDFKNRVLHSLRPPEDDARFVERTLAAARKLPPTRKASRRLRPMVGLAWAASLVVAAGLGAIGTRPRDGRPPADAPARQAAAPAFEPAPPAAPPPREARPGGEPTEAAADPRLTRVTGSVFVMSSGVREEARDERPLEPGRALVTVGKHSGATVAYADDTRVQLEGDGALVPLGTAAGAPPRKGLFLARGRLIAEVSRQPAGAPLVFSTPHGEATVLGTRLTLAVTDQHTRLDVDRGLVRLTDRRGAAAAEVSAGRYALLRGDGSAPVVAAAAVRGRAFLLVGSDNPVGLDEAGLNAPDQKLKARLASLGLEVHVARVGPDLASVARGFDLVVISDTVSSFDLQPGMRDLPAPMLVLEWFLYDELGLTGPCGEEEDCGTEVSPGHLLIKNPSHPLAAGLTGTVRFTEKPGPINWGIPSVHAEWIATVPGRPDRALVFAYDRGAAMPGARAPARRVALPYRGKTTTTLSQDGWALFDAAVRWALDAPAR